MSGYLGPSPVPQATQTRETFTATASQTSFATGGYQAGYIDVFLNGVKLVDGTDFTATNGSDVVLTTGAASGDTLEVVAYTAFTVADQTFTGDIVMSDGLTVDNDGATVLTVDRATSDGTIIDVQKNGTSVGSIGTWSGTSYIGAGDTGLAFGFGNNDIRPFDPSTVSQRDAAVDLGESGTRFKDLYLSGGVYLGGTGSANKLDDYEEGTWTVTMEPSAGFTATNNTSTGYYTKIGNVVTVSGIAQMTTPASLGTWSNDNINFALLVSGLPFNVGSALQRRSAPALGVTSTIGWSSGNVLMGHGSSSGNDFNVFQCKGNGALRTSPNLATSSAHSLHFGFTYTTD